MYGWAGTILRVDLTSGKIGKEPLSPEFARKYLGGRGYNAIRLFELVGPEVDALSPENVIMFAIGPLAGTIVPGAGRVEISAKSPLTDVVCYSSVGGFFGQELKYSGYDQVIVSGRAERPVYLWIHDDEVELRDASHLWGKTTEEAADEIRVELGDLDIPMFSIGQAGENLVRYACIKYEKGAAGRGGMGAVMGSKNLKAIAAKGSKGVAIARLEEFSQACNEVRQRAIEGLTTINKLMHELGTPSIMELYFDIYKRAIPRRNYDEDGLSYNWQAVSGKALKEQFTRAMKACPSCPIACKVFHTVDTGEFAGIRQGTVEFALTTIGPRCEFDNLPAILKINELCNLYGIDDCSVSYMLCWAMDCYDRGILTDADLDGSSLKWGDYRAVIEMLPKIAHREGFGNILAEGEKKAPGMGGRGSEKFMYHVKGSQFMPEDPRIDKAFGLQMFTSPRGGDHLTGSLFRMRPILGTTEVGRELAEDPETHDVRSYKNKGMVVKWCEDITEVVDALGMCTRPASAVSFELLTRLASSATGIDFSEKGLLEVGERIFNVLKAFNSREGLTRKDDYGSVPEKFTKEPVSGGPYNGEVLDLDTLLDEYYEARGWDLQTGLQVKEKLKELGLEHIIKELDKIGAVK